MSSCPHRARFDNMDAAYFAILLFLPAPNVIGVKLEPFRGLPKRGLAFGIASGK